MIVVQGNVLIGEVVNRAALGVELKGGQWAAWAAQLLTRLIEVVGVEVQIAKGVNKGLGAQATDLGDHPRQQSVGGYVKGNA